MNGGFKVAKVREGSKQKHAELLKGSTVKNMSFSNRCQVRFFDNASGLYFNPVDVFSFLGAICRVMYANF